VFHLMVDDFLFNLLLAVGKKVKTRAVNPRFYFLPEYAVLYIVAEDLLMIPNKSAMMAITSNA